MYPDIDPNTPLNFHFLLYSVIDTNYNPFYFAQNLLMILKLFTEIYILDTLQYKLQNLM